MNQETKKQAIVAGVAGIVVAVLALLATNPKVRRAFNDCQTTLKGGDLLKAAKGGNLMEIAKSYAVSIISVAEKKLGALKAHLEPKS